MYIAELHVEGTWLDTGDEESDHSIGNMLDGLIHAFYEANMSLNLFNEERERLGRISPDDIKRIYRERDLRLKQIIEKIRVKYVPNVYEDMTKMMADAQVMLKKEDWENDKLPQQLEVCKLFIFAKSFLYSIDTLYEILEKLSLMDRVPVPIGEGLKVLQESLPDLRGVRNSAHHMEDRIRGIGRDKKPMELKPFERPHLKSTNGSLALSYLRGTQFGCTMGDGHYGEVDVSVFTLDIVEIVVQQTLNSFKWKGPKRHLPG